MPTADRRINVYEKRLLSRTGINTQFLQFLIDELDENIAAIFQSTSGVLDQDTIDLDSSANDTFSLDLTNASRVITDAGHVIDLSLITGTGITDDIPFENANAVLYYVGIRFAEVEDGIELNPRTGDPEYPAFKQTYGELGTPNSLTDTFQSNLRVFINDITESGVDHSGRTVRVWLADPVSGVESIAYFEGTSAYSAPNNYVDIPYSGAAGPLGQDTSSNPPSTTPADYKIFIEGATWRRNTDLRTDSAYAFIGIVTGNGPAATPTVFDTSDQVPIFINTLDRAYDGAGGSGSGRNIFVDSGSVRLRSGTSAGDEQHAQLYLDRLGNTQQFQISLLIEGARLDSIPIAILEPLNTGTTILEQEAVDLSGADLLTFTRGAVDLTDTSIFLNVDRHVVLIEDTSTADGLYGFDAFTTNTMDIVDLKTGAAPSSWPAESGNARVFVVRAILAAAGNVPGHLTGLLADWYGTMLMSHDGSRVNAPLRLLGNGDSGECQRVEPQVGMSGISLDGGGGRRDSAAPALSIRMGTASITRGGITDQGTPITGHRHVDHMFYHPNSMSISNMPPFYDAIVQNSGTIFAVENTGGSTGRVELTTDTGSGDFTQMTAPGCMPVDSDQGFQWVFRARLKLSSLTDIITGVGLGIGGATGNISAFFEFESGVNGERWRFRWTDSTLTQTNDDTGHSAVTATHHWFQIAMVGSQTFTWEISDGTNHDSGSADLATNNFSGDGTILRPHVFVETKTTAAKDVAIDYWEWYDYGGVLLGLSGNEE